ncbi:hypothetical protein JVU11DRAFT_6918 [Chiua virens]|nr:hypothetical protein JVU11DRAFT_6918 [Chiua virens]
MELPVNQSDAIVAKVQHEMAIAKGKMIKVESDGNNNNNTPRLSILCPQVMSMRLMFKCASGVKEHDDIEDMLELPCILYRFHAKLWCQEFSETKQTTLYNRYMKY